MTQVSDMLDNDQKNIDVLFIGFVWPEITSTAASQNIISYLLTFIKAGYRVHFACAAQASPLSTNLKSLNVITHDIVLNSPCFDQLVHEIAPEIVVFDRFLTEEQFGWRVIKVAPNALRVMDCEDLHFLRHARHQLYKRTGFQPKNPIYLQPCAVLQAEHEGYLYSEMTSREMASIYRCDLVITLSAFEKELLVSRFGLRSSNVVHVPYLIDTSAPNVNELNSLLRVDFISIGNFRHAPNIDAVNVLIQHLWPGIHKALPEAKCHIYGAYLPPRIKQLHNPKDGLHIHGHIDDHFAVLLNAKVLLAPIAFGAGVKGKIVDALRCGLPSITTPIGTEGIDFDIWPGAQVSNRDAFIQGAINTYQASANEMSTMQQTMQRVLAQNFDTQNNQQRLLEAVDHGYKELRANRTSNFMQQLVSHHSLQTHQYMSQWIAAKNANIEATNIGTDNSK